MKRLSIVLVFLCSKTILLMAQQKDSIAGIYSLRGVMETASGFKLNQDSTFEFYFSYGALDRYATGKWTVNQDSIVFNSKPYPGRDFKIIDSAKTEDDFITLKIDKENASLYHFVYCLYKTANGDSLINADRDGVIILPQQVDTIHLLFELSSERLSSFIVHTSGYNSYTFKLEPWAFEMFLKNFSLLYLKKSLEGYHPLRNDKIFTYEKEE